MDFPSLETVLLGNNTFVNQYETVFESIPENPMMRRFTKTEITCSGKASLTRQQ